MRMGLRVELLLLGVCVWRSACQEYDMAHTVNCSLLSDQWTLQQNLKYLWNIVELHDVDRYAFLVGSPLIMAVQGVFVYAFCKFGLYRSSPMDIILLCFLSEMVLNLCFFINAIYYSLHSIAQPMPDSFPAFCMVTAVLNTSFTILEMLYLLYFLVYAILSVKKSIKKKQWFQTKVKHVVPVLITVCSSVGIWALGWFGLSQFGFCTVVATRNSDLQVYLPAIQLTFAITFVIFACFSYRYFREHMPEGEALNRRKFEENAVMSRFVIGMSAILVVLSVATLALYLNCLHPEPLMLVWATVFNLTKLGEFVYLIVVMVAYKKVANKVGKLFRGLFSQPSRNSVMLIQEKRLTEKQLFDFIDIGMKEKILDIQEDESQIDFIRITQVITILTGIKIAYQEYLSPLLNIDRIHDLKSLFFHEEVSFQIGPKLIKQYEQAAHILPRISLLRGRFTIFAPRVFSRLLAQDQVGEIWRSFGLMENRDQLYRIVDSEGGRSGEFFFFTSDCRFILKTLNEDEFAFLLEYLEDFYGHFLTYPHTLLAKPYGMFRIQSEVSQTYHILLMKNTAGCPKEQVLRTYDMKGSTADRMTLKHHEQEDAATGRVLKDLDFRRLQHQLEIDPAFAKDLRQQLRIDSEFLMDLNLIDYSLLVMRIQGEPGAPREFWGRLARAPSTVNTGQHYHIALIDYLQRWDLGKQSEKWWKNLFGKYDVSAQQPTVYQQRFIRFLKEITSCDSHRGTRERFSREPTSDLHTELPTFSQAIERIKISELSSLTLPKKPPTGMSVPR